MAEEISKSKQLNDMCQGMYKRYIDAIGLQEKNIDDDGRKFLYRCAVCNMSPKKVSRMYEQEKSIRNLLEDIYISSVHETTIAGEDNQITNAITSEWSDASLTLAELYPSYMGLPIILKMISEIARQEPFSDYREYFDMIMATDEINCEQLLCIRNNNTEKKRECMHAIYRKADSISRKLDNLPDGILSHEAANLKEMLENQNKVLEEKNKELEKEMNELNEALEQRKVEIAKQKQMEERQAEEKQREKLANENRRLQQQVNALKEQLQKENDGFKNSHDKKYGITKKSKKYALIKLMSLKGYDAERIGIINNALEKKIPVPKLMEIVEQDYDVGQLKEIIKIME